MILFADPTHGARSQMAEALLRFLDRRGELTVSSAGTEPAPDLAGVQEILGEMDVPFNPGRQALRVDMAPDLLVIVCEEGCDACPWLPWAARVERWPLDDPARLSGDARIEALRTVREQLGDRIQPLLDRYARQQRRR